MQFKYNNHVDANTVLSTYCVCYALGVEVWDFQFYLIWFWRTFFAILYNVHLDFHSWTSKRDKYCVKLGFSVSNVYTNLWGLKFGCLTRFPALNRLKGIKQINFQCLASNILVSFRATMRYTYGVT